MPCTLQWEPPLVTGTFTGIVTVAEFLGAAQEINADSRFDELRYIVSDFTDMAGHTIDLDDIAESLAVMGIGGMATNPNIQVVIITTDETLIALDRMVHAAPLSCSHGSVIFDDRASAKQWIENDALTPKWAMRTLI